MSKLVMSRRGFTTLVGSAAVMWPLAARAQQGALPLVGIVTIGDRQTTLQGIWHEAFFQRLGDLGWTPGRNIAIRYCFADNKPDELPALVNDLIRLKPDAIYVPTRPALPAVKKATTAVPIVFVSLGDPVFEGWVSSLAKPGGNLTGVAGLSPELAGKRLQLLREIIPTLAKVAILHNPGNPSEEVAIRATEMAAQNLGVSVFVELVRDSDEFDGAISAVVRNGADSIIVLPDPMFNTHRAELVQLIAQSRLPAIYMETGLVAAGGLISYGPNLKEMFRRSADYLDKVLRGAKPADLPIEQPTRFELTVNLKAAKALGISIPQSILAGADDVIE